MEKIFGGELLVCFWLIHQYLGAPQKIVFWSHDTFDHNFDIENGFTKYLKESCR